MCIYYSNRTDLKYTSKEHIIPAAIGGISTLNIGIVSDEFNTDISKLESEFIHKFLSIPRELEGPGKRGSLNPKKASQSRIYVFSQPGTGNFSLGYMSNSKPHEIPHIFIDTNTGRMSMSVPAEKGRNGFEEFKNDALSVGNSKIHTIVENAVPENVVLFGIHQGQYYFAKHKLNTTFPTAESIYRAFEKIEIPDHGFENTKYQPKVHSKHLFQIDYFRIYAKIAFNYLAKIRGKDFAINNQFDAIRNWIAHGGENEFATIDKINIDHLSKLIDWKVVDKVPEYYHFITIKKVENYLVCHVLLYSKFGAQIILSKEFKSHFSADSLICDWKNRREFGLREFLATQLHDNKTE